jgi:leukotriene-A4 hydrolase
VHVQFRCAWLQLCIAAEDEAVLEDAQQFVAGLGRMKLIRPIYKALFTSKMGQSIAVSTFEALKAGYHPIARKVIAADLGCTA